MNVLTRSHRTRWAWIGACLLTVLPAAAGQQDDPPGRPTLRQIVERRLERVQEEQVVYERALRLLAEGASEARIRELIGEHLDRRGREHDPAGREGATAAHDDRGSRDGRHDNRRQLSPEETQRVLSFIETHFPQLWERVSALEPETRARMAERFAPRFFEYKRAETRDLTLGVLKLDELKAGFKLLDSIGDFRRALKSGADSTELNAAKRRVRQALQVQFDAQQAGKRREVVLLDERVGELERELSEREAERNEILDDKLEDITSKVARGGDRRRRGG